jgi:hypothetical protein
MSKQYGMRLAIISLHVLSQASCRCMLLRIVGIVLTAAYCMFATSSEQALLPSQQLHQPLWTYEFDHSAHCNAMLSNICGNLYVAMRYVNKRIPSLELFSFDSAGSLEWRNTSSTISIREALSNDGSIPMMLTAKQAVRLFASVIHSRDMNTLNIFEAQEIPVIDSIEYNSLPKLNNNINVSCCDERILVASKNGETIIASRKYSLAYNALVSLDRELQLGLDIYPTADVVAYGSDSRELWRVSLGKYWCIERVLYDDGNGRLYVLCSEGYTGGTRHRLLCIIVK